MFCPNCGQQQVSQEIKFCSRCGFPLGLVAEILAHGGFLPQLADLYKSKKIFTKSNGIKFGLIWFLFWSFLLTPLLAIAGGDEIVAVTAVLGFVGGIIIMILSVLFLQNEPKNLQDGYLNQKEKMMPANLKANRTQSALPPQQTQPAQSYVPPGNVWKSADTGDLVHPHSVTENTTKLLKKEE